MALVWSASVAIQAKGQLGGKRPKLSAKQHVELGRMRDSGQCSILDLTDLFSVSGPTVSRTLPSDSDTQARWVAS